MVDRRSFLKTLAGLPVALAVPGAAAAGPRAAIVSAGPARWRRERGRWLSAPLATGAAALAAPRGHGHARVWARTRRNGRWSAWDALPNGCGGLLWVARADALQVATDRSPERVAVHLVSGAGHRFRIASTSGPVVVAGSPPLLPRSAWADATCEPREAPLFGTVQAGLVHHTVNANDYDAADVPAILRAIFHYHVDVNGWNDLGYNFVVDRFGRIWEGRAGGVTEAVVGAQAQGYNAQTTGVANLGTFTTEGQTAVALRALARTLAWKLTLHGAPLVGTIALVSAGGPLNRYPEGMEVVVPRIAGHGDVDATACPGDGLRGQLPQIRALAQGPRAPVSAFRPVRALAVRPSRAVAGRALAVTGSAPGARVTVVVERRSRRGWRRVRTLRPRTRNGRFRTVVRLAPGRYRLRLARLKAPIALRVHTATPPSGGARPGG